MQNTRIIKNIKYKKCSNNDFCIIVEWMKEEISKCDGKLSPLDLLSFYCLLK